MTLADSVGTLGVDLRTKVKRLGAKEKKWERKKKSEGEEVQSEISAYKKE